jgi:hypothetical protein
LSHVVFAELLVQHDLALASPADLRRISSPWTWFYKRAFPFIWYGFLGTFSAFLLPAILDRPDVAFALISISFMALVGYLVMRYLLLDLMDEVWIDGDDLLLRNGGEEDRFPITNVVNVDDTQLMNPERITLTLRTPSRFGDEPVFTSSKRYWPFGKHPIAKELIRRAHRLDELTAAAD